MFAEIKSMRFAIIGSRTFDNYELLKQTISKYENIELIISGGAQGADTLGAKYANENNIPLKILKPQWNDLNAQPCVIKYKYGKPYNVLAGFNRNTNIINNATHVIAFWDGKSNGTKDSIAKAIELNKILEIIKYK